MVFGTGRGGDRAKGSNLTRLPRPCHTNGAGGRPFGPPRPSAAQPVAACPGSNTFFTVQLDRLGACQWALLKAWMRAPDHYGAALVGQRQLPWGRAELRGSGRILGGWVGVVQMSRAPAAEMAQAAVFERVRLR